ncbi:hypothetical protein HK104_011350 [Borealophlyctis nickersoniae]|nr:hypothetical protein HK104_011350 [Borealophlyctis nickersoniae]
MSDVCTALDEPTIYYGRRGGTVVWDADQGITFQEDVVVVEDLLDVVVETLEGSESLSFKPKANDITLMFVFRRWDAGGGYAIGRWDVESQQAPRNPRKDGTDSPRRGLFGGMLLRSDTAINANWYGGAFMNAAISELEKNMHVLVPEHLNNIEHATAHVQEGAFVYSENVAPMNIKSFFQSLDKSAADANAPPSNSTNATPTAPTGPKRRRAALARIAGIGPKQYLETLNFPMQIRLPEIPWSYVGPIKRVAPPDMALHIGLTFQKAGKPLPPSEASPSCIIEDRHAMIVAWLEIMGIMFRRGLILADRIREVVEGVREISDLEWDLVSDGTKLVGEIFPELLTDETGCDFSLYVVFGLVLLAQDGIAYESLKDILEEKRWFLDRKGSRDDEWAQ